MKHIFRAKNHRAKLRLNGPTYGGLCGTWSHGWAWSVWARSGLTGCMAFAHNHVFSGGFIHRPYSIS